ncbi:hypothetical protein R3W88_001223 [Solanum pinnatisectum]|uniref:Ionotropic glutamate receptor C-terminal domain-containing protein n=1 Tax=Solanum pinnatisectum TaxID=50273 RepID=A0AAV9MHW8_9SOLN|nr:hypothetical protein R3W88_001223 [Solanum pinnatisectum]
MDEWFGKMGLSCISMALSDFNNSSNGSNYNTIDFLFNFDQKSQVPIISFSTTREGIILFLAEALEEINTRIPYRSVFSKFTTLDQIKSELFKLMNMQTRVFIVPMPISLGSKLFAMAKEIGMMSKGFVWIVTDSMADQLNLMDVSVIESMEGVIRVKPYVPKRKKVKDFIQRWKMQFLEENSRIVDVELDVYGLWAYDSATVLAMAVEKSKIRNATNLEAIGVSRDGPKLLQAILNTTFKESTNNLLVAMHDMGSIAILQSPPYHIINVIGNGAKDIGFWTRENGIVRKLNSRRGYSVSKENFGSIIWPDLTTNTTIVTGYCIDVFDAVMEPLPYYVPYEYVPFAAPDGKSADDYNELVYQVFLGNFDVVVGDTTIVSNRSQFVDFTLPYSESGVTMMVPIKDDNRDNTWVFFKPLTWELWLTSFCSFVFIGFVIWLLEHRVNEDFRGPFWHQVGMIFWFSFSTMVFAQKERIVSNLVRFVLIIWFLVVLILTSSYTASLTSMLTVEKLLPTDYVGYQPGSFVVGLLRKMNFDEDRLKAYNTPEECIDLLAKGSSNGGIAAIFDEIPYVKLFLANYCLKFTAIGPTYKTDAVLNMTEGEKMVQIERAWFGESTCSDSSTSLSSNILALIIFLTKFIHEPWHIIRRSNLLARKKQNLGQEVRHKDYSCWKKLIMDEDKVAVIFRSPEEAP